MSRLKEITKRVESTTAELPKLIQPERSHVRNLEDFKYLLDLVASLERECAALRAALTQAKKQLAELLEGAHYEYCVPEDCPSVSEHIKREMSEIEKLERGDGD
jgi:hypothetical protein